MRRLGDVLDEKIRSKHLELTDQQRRMLADYYRDIRAWKAQEMSLSEVMERSQSGWLRMQFMMHTPRDHEMYEDMMTLIDAIWRKQRGPGVETPQGWLTEEMVKSHGGRLVEVVDPETGMIDLAPVYPTSFGRNMDGTPDKSNPIYSTAPRRYTPPVERPIRRSAGYEEWTGAGETAVEEYPFDDTEEFTELIYDYDDQYT